MHNIDGDTALQSWSNELQGTQMAQRLAFLAGQLSRGKKKSPSPSSCAAMSAAANPFMAKEGLCRGHRLTSYMLQLLQEGLPKCACHMPICGKHVTDSNYVRRHRVGSICSQHAIAPVPQSEAGYTWPSRLLQVQQEVAPVESACSIGPPQISVHIASLQAREPHTA